MALENLVWTDLPHWNQIGHGRQGIVLRLSDTKCIKLYAPEHEHAAGEECARARDMLVAGLRVPKPRAVVSISIPKGVAVELPNADDDEEKSGLATYTHLRSVTGLVREYVKGACYSDILPIRANIKLLLDYLLQAREKGFVFSDVNPLDFVLNDRGVYCTDLSFIQTRGQLGEQVFDMRSSVMLSNMVDYLQGGYDAKKDRLFSLLFSQSRSTLKRDPKYRSVLQLRA